VISFQVLVDSDAFVAWSLPDDHFHQHVHDIFERLATTGSRLVSTSWVIAETATVLSYRGGQTTARMFLQRIVDIGMPIIHISEPVQAETTELFKGQNARGTSMVDCSNAVIMEHFEIPEIFSFDHFYRHLKLKKVER
jgi:predicted nucleic acid-binding protein